MAQSYLRDVIGIPQVDLDAVVQAVRAAGSTLVDEDILDLWREHSETYGETWSRPDADIICAFLRIPAHTFA